jgi:Ni/Fe-hydrogenase 1 B-type cytochrome subunit
MDDQLTNKPLIEYSVWDKPVRYCHWLNVLCVLCLIAIGTIILNSKALGVTSDGKILLKTWHVYVGYIFALNLTFRIVWGFMGNSYARWRAILPVGPTFRAQFSQFIVGLKQGKPVGFLGHNPLARLMVTLLFLLMTIQALSGLVLAGTDVYMPPFGGVIKQWVAVDDTSVDLVKPYSKEGVDEQAYKEMRAVRQPFITVHYTLFFVLLGAIILHVLGVIWTENREGNGIVSAMFTGKKFFKDKPIDFEQ